jgi:hypothetical protein
MKIRVVAGGFHLMTEQYLPCANAIALKRYAIIE